MVSEESINSDQTLIKIITNLQHSTDERIMADVPELEWRDFFGSSVSLAPALMSIYDETKPTMAEEILSTLSGSVVKNESEFDTSSNVENPNNTFVPKAILGERTESLLNNQTTDTFPSKTYEVIDFSGISRDEKAERMLSTFESTNSVCSHMTEPMFGSSVTVQDDKKRPLSITSTSSSASSSSLPRQQRKKKMSHFSHAHGGNGFSKPNDAGIEMLSTVNERSPMPAISTKIGAYKFFDNANFSSIEYPLNRDTCQKSLTCRRSSSLGSRPKHTSLQECYDYFRSARTASVCSEQSNREKDSSVMSNVEDEDGSTSIINNCCFDQNSSQDDDSQSFTGGSMHIRRIVAEILDTEEAYVKDLQDIIQGYIENIKMKPELNVKDEERDAIFGNIEMLHSFNREFLAQLKCCNDDPIKIAQCFFDKSEGFAMYSDYCTNYPRSVEVLMECLKNSDIAAAFYDIQLHLRHGLPLASYLLKPVQRIVKYHLFLQNILNNYNGADEERIVVQMALDSMMRIAHHINEMKRHHEYSIQSQEIHNCLEGVDIASIGDLVLKDKLHVCGSKSFRLVFLFTKAVIIAKEKEDGSVLVKALIMCSNLMLIERISKLPLAFHLIPFDSARKQYTLQARNMEQKRLWCQQIKKVMLDNYDVAIPEKAKEIVMMLGKNREESTGTVTDKAHIDILNLLKKHRSPPGYLQKRKGRQKSTGGSDAKLKSDAKLQSRKAPPCSAPIVASASPSMILKTRHSSDLDVHNYKDWNNDLDKDGSTSTPMRGKDVDMPATPEVCSKKLWNVDAIGGMEQITSQKENSNKTKLSNQENGAMRSAQEIGVSQQENKLPLKKTNNITADPWTLRDSCSPSSTSLNLMRHGFYSPGIQRRSACQTPSINSTSSNLTFISISENGSETASISSSNRNPSMSDVSACGTKMDELQNPHRKGSLDTDPYHSLEVDETSLGETEPNRRGASLPAILRTGRDVFNFNDVDIVDSPHRRIGSFRNAITNFTSKLPRFGSKSVNSENYPEVSFQSSDVSTDSDVSVCNSSSGRYLLQKSHDRQTKRGNRSTTTENKLSATDKDLSCLLKDLKPGSCAIGERMAQACSIEPNSVNSMLTLKKRKPRKRLQGKDGKTLSDIKTKTLEEPSLCTAREETDSGLITSRSEVSSTTDENFMDDSKSVSLQENISSKSVDVSECNVFYYENRLMDDLERTLSSQDLTDVELSSGEEIEDNPSVNLSRVSGLTMTDTSNILENDIVSKCADAVRHRSFSDGNLVKTFTSNGDFPRLISSTRSTLNQKLMSSGKLKASSLSSLPLGTH